MRANTIMGYLNMTPGSFLLLFAAVCGYLMYVQVICDEYLYSY